MWIQVRSVDGLIHQPVHDVSKLTTIAALKEMLVSTFEAPVDRIRLFFRGKQLEDGHKLFDYGISLNDVVQVLVRPVVDDDVELLRSLSTTASKSDADKENQPTLTPSYLLEENATSRYYKLGDVVDVKDLQSGAWFEGKVQRIQKRSTVLDLNSEFSNSPPLDTTNENLSASSGIIDDGLDYHILLCGYENNGTAKMQLKDFRPRSYRKIPFEDIKEETKVIVNYNINNPGHRGFFYHSIVKGKHQYVIYKDETSCLVKKNGDPVETEDTDKDKIKTVRELTVNLILGSDEVELEDCRIRFLDEVYEIENHKLLTDENVSEREALLKDPSQNVPETQGSPVVRLEKLTCLRCRDITTRKCKHCGCHVCGGKEEPEKQVLCDECDLPYHIGCLNPPLTEVPAEDEWYCPECKIDTSEIVHAGENLKESKRKAKMASATSSSTRDWGKGMACVGRTKECTLVPCNHFGPIPGIEVGTLWKFRVQVSESGVHRPHVAGIHGRENEGAYSIVLSGGYEDDLDNGDEFYYTGSGGRDLSGNKRTAEQSRDQTLARMNRALAMNCAANINPKVGAEAKKWKDGKPVRVVRNCKGGKHSQYSPEEGCRYDGIYKVVKYWPEKGKSGYLVWRYLLRRDDPDPAPWTKAGKKRTEELGLTLQYPEGYLEAMEKTAQSSSKKGSKGKRPKEDDEDTEKESPDPKRAKKAECVAVYIIPPAIKKLIDEDQNKKLWEECKKHVTGGSKAFLKKVEEMFTCVCCQEVVHKPITTDCSHNICLSCLTRSFKAGVFTCPMCRHNLGRDYVLNVNTTLQSVLQKLFPGYDAGR